MTQDKNITKNTIERISSELNRLAEEFEINKIFSYAPVQQKNIIEVSKTIKEATSNLSDGEKVYLTEANGSNIELPKKINIQVTEKDLDYKEKSIENESEQILKIKKTDYIADSAWELKFGRIFKNIKIEDSVWINKFLNKERNKNLSRRFYKM